MVKGPRASLLKASVVVAVRVAALSKPLLVHLVLQQSTLVAMAERRRLEEM
jgi:hypothetical protein